jgi:uncharacterized protein (TIGR02145 family)
MACKYYDITISGIDIADATGNTISPNLNGKVFVKYTDCDGTEQEVGYDTAGTYVDEFCANNDELVLIGFYSNNDFNVTLNSTYSEQGDCSVTCFGYLYNWYAATDVRNISAAGWEVPTISDYQILSNYLGAAGNYVSNVVGGKLKETGLTYWVSPNVGATNEVGFNAIGSGGRTTGFGQLGTTGFFWTRDNPFSATGYLALLSNSNQNFICATTISFLKKDGYGLRLKKITTTLVNGQTGTYVGNDGKTYDTICIGTQEWVSQNLTETKYRDLSPIPNVTTQSTWSGLTTGAYCIYNNDPLNVIGCPELPTPTTLCFEYIGLNYPNPSEVFLCDIDSAPSLYNGKNYWILSDCAQPEQCSYFDIGFVWWNDLTSSWYNSTTLGGTGIYEALSELQNPGDYPIQIPGVYEWTFLPASFCTCCPSIINSNLGSCSEPTPTPTPTPTNTQTPTKTPTQTPTQTQTPTNTVTSSQTPSTTPISCGLGLIKTNSEYYYTDCCGNFISGFNNTGDGLQVSFNYNLPRGGVGKLNVPATASCPSPTPTPTQTVTPTNTATPTITPTNTQTPTPSITPSITPSNSPVARIQNNCDVITLFDMGISCNVIQNPSSPTSLDGIISVNVTGGTAPYSYYWNGNAGPQTLFGVTQGEYEIFVTDFSWPDGGPDYTASTICSLFGPTPTQTPTMTPTPTSTRPIQCVELCMIITDSIRGTTILGPIQFECYGYKNGQFTWFGEWNGKPIYIIWNPINNRWELYSDSEGNQLFNLGSTSLSNYGTIIASTSTNAIPLSAWDVYGGESNTNVTVTTGSCPEYSPLSLNLDATNNSCIGIENCDGSIIANAQGGLAPYDYSINGGITTQQSPSFNNLCPNDYEVIVYDSAGNQQSSVVNIGYNGSPVTYQLSITNFGSPVSSTVPNVSDNLTQTYKIVSVPPIPVGLTISFNLSISNTKTYLGPGNGTIHNTLIITKNSVQQTPTFVSNVPVIGNRPNCSPYLQTGITETNSIILTMSYNDVIEITENSNLILTSPNAGDNRCTTELIQTISSNITQMEVVGNECSTAVGGSRTLLENTITYLPTELEPWTPTDIVCNFRSVNFTSIKGSGEAMPTTVYVPEDGTRMYLPMYGTKKINQYSLSVPHNINSTITFINSGPTLPFYFNGMQMSSDGTKVFVFGNAYEAVIREYTLSVPWDITTMSTSANASLTYPIPGSSTALVGRTPSFNRDGTKIYATYYISFGGPNPNIAADVVWELSTPYSLSSAGTPITNNITSSISSITGNMYFENGTNKYFTAVGNGLPQVAVFENGITNNDLYGVNNDCLFVSPDCQDNIHIYDSLRSSGSPFVWTLRQSKTGLL